MRFVAAIGMGGEWALGVALVMEVWDAKYRPFLAGLIGAASNVGFLLVGVVGWVFKVNETNWRLVAVIGRGAGRADVHHSDLRARIAQVAGDRKRRRRPSR